MPWVVDTCVLIDILDADPVFGEPSADLLEQWAEEGLVICPVSYVELSPCFLGSQSLQDEFLAGVGVSFIEGWERQDVLAAHEAWHLHVENRRRGHLRKRPLADILIGSFAMRFRGLLTRNPKDFRQAFPKLRLEMPNQKRP